MVTLQEEFKATDSDQHHGVDTDQLAFLYSEFPTVIVVINTS